MSKRITILALYLALALLLCEIGLTVTDTSYRYVADALSGSSETQSRSLSPIAGDFFTELGTPESIRGHNNGSLFSIRTQTNGRESQRLGARLLLLFVSVFCFLKVAFQHLRFRLFLPDNAIAYSVILLFIHSKDGKK